MKENDGINGSAINGTYRLVLWHPDVHHKFGEQLYFFLISPVSYDMWFKITVEKILRSCDVLGWCLYNVYGFHDLLLRCWMSPQQMNEFIKQLQRETSLMDLAQFLCIDIDYLWSDTQKKIPHIPEATIEQYDPVTLTEIQTKKPDTSTINTLMEKGLILKDEMINTNQAFRGVKFYMLVTYSVPTSQNTMREEIIKHVSSNYKTVKDISVYTGTGFANFLIKGVVGEKNIFDIYDFAISLSTHFRTLRMKTSTVLVATPKAFESDNVHFSRNATPDAIKSILDKLVIEENSLSGMSKHDLVTIQENFNEYLHNDELTKHSDTFEPIFKGILTKNNREIKRSLYIILDFEGMFKNFGYRVMGKLYGKNWVKEKYNTIREKTKIPTHDTDKLTLNDWITILGKVDSADGFVSTILGDDWEANLRTTASFRNQFAHGRLDDPLGMWENILSFLIEFLPIYNRVENWIKKRNN